LSSGTISGKTNAEASDARHKRANMATTEHVTRKTRYGNEKQNERIEELALYGCERQASDEPHPISAPSTPSLLQDSSSDG
jgi:hypothetical protein